MPKMTVEMTEEEVRFAIVQWASKKHGMAVDPSQVSMTVEETWRGHGMAEEKYHRPVVKFTIT